MCSFDSSTHKCSCGKIEDGAVVYIKNAKSGIAAAFMNLQEAVDYVDESRDVTSTAIIGFEDVSFICESLTINSGDYVFDLSKNTVTFNGTGIVMSSSSAVFNIEDLRGYGIPITVNSGGILDLNSNSSTDFSYAVDLHGTGKVSLTGNDVTICSFQSENNDSVTINAETNVTLFNSEYNDNLINSLTANSSKNIEIENHTSHNYNSITQKCICGEINANAVLYVGSSFEGATARFVNLQDAADYVCDVQSKTASSDVKTVVGVSDKVVKCNESNNCLNLQKCNIEFDLSECSFPSVVDISVSGSDVKFGWVSDLTCTVALSDSSILEFTGGNIFVNSFISDSNSEICFNTGNVVRANSTTTAKSLRNYLSGSNTSSIDVDGHQHSYLSKNDGTYYWHECSDCGFCTEKVHKNSKWVSFFYLDMSNLTALEDIEEIVEYVPNPTNVTIYIITGGGQNIGKYTEDSMYYNPFHKTNDNYDYPKLAQAILNGGGDTSLRFYDSSVSDNYQYWKYYSKGGKGCFIELSHTPTRKMSDGWVLKDFIDHYYKQEKSANTRYFLHLWNHGGGNMWGMMQDFTEAHYMPIMSMKDMDDSVSATNFVKDGNKFDIILFDMCEMQQIETVNMVKDYAKCMIGSENSSVSSRLGSIYKHMNDTPYDSYQNIAIDFITETDKKQSNGYYKYSSRTWSALDLLYLDKIDRINENFNAFLGVVLKSDKSNIDSALSNSVDYAIRHDTNSYDIYSFAYNFSYSNKSDLLASIENILICNKFGTSVSGTTGLAFYFDPYIKSTISSYGSTAYNEYIERAEPLYSNLVKLFEKYRNNTSW